MLKLRVTSLILAVLLSCAAKAADPVCLPPPDKYGDEVPKTSCETIDGVKGCVYVFDTEFPAKVRWRCAIVITQQACRLPWKPTGVFCEPYGQKPPAEAKK